MHYTLLKYWVRWALRLFYFRHQVVGLENVPKEGGAIFIGNHQNAVMDAFNIICNSGREPYFATRADLFNKDWIRKLLLAFKMYPVYRLRDGRANMKQNEDAFDFFSQRLAEGNTVGIFPEGEASYKYQLLPFKKGMARLAFRALEKNPEQALYIIPSGLQYERKHHYQADLLVQFGKPILVNDYYELYQEKPAKAIRQLTLDTHPKLAQLLIDIPDEDYNFINKEREIVHHNTRGNLAARFRKEKAFIEKPWNPYRKKKYKNWKIIYGIISPILLIGLLFHYPLRRIIDWRVHRKVKDNQFYASLKFAYGFLLFPMYYLILGIFLCIYFNPFYLLLLPVITLGGRWIYRIGKDIYMFLF